MSRSPLILAGRTAVVTGAGSGIGRALAVAAAARGMTVVACDISAEGLAETAREGGSRIGTEVLDVSDEGAVDRLAARIRHELPPLALLFANAGILRQASVTGLPVAEWRRLFEVNVIGVVNLLNAFAPTMASAAEASRIVVTGSTGAMSNPAGLSAYCATKHALWPIAEGLRQEMDGAGAPVGVSFLMPGAVATHIFASAQPDRPAPADSISPEKVAEIVFTRLDEDPPFILTHPHFVERAEQRFAETVRQLRD